MKAERAMIEPRSRTTRPLSVGPRSEAPPKSGRGQEDSKHIRSSIKFNKHNTQMYQTKTTSELREIYVTCKQQTVTIKPPAVSSHTAVVLVKSKCHRVRHRSTVPVVGGTTLSCMDYINESPLVRVPVVDVLANVVIHFKYNSFKQPLFATHKSTVKATTLQAAPHTALS